LPKGHKTVVREFALLIIPAPDGGYLAYCPAIYGYYSRGKTPAQARKQLSENIKNYLFDLAAAGKPLPRSNGRIEKLKFAVPA
jgi:predicted RNase H-like HicB family nuclease